MRDNGGESGRNSNQDKELRPHRVLLANAGDLDAISSRDNELQRHRVLLDNAASRSGPTPVRLRHALALTQRGVRCPSHSLRIGMGPPPPAVLLAPSA